MAGTAVFGWLTLVWLAAEPAADEAAPSPELLMYLGEFEDADGEFVDPMALDKPAATADAPVKDKDETDDEDPARPG